MFESANLQKNLRVWKFLVNFAVAKKQKSIIKITIRDEKDFSTFTTQKSQQARFSPENGDKERP